MLCGHAEKASSLTHREERSEERGKTRRPPNCSPLSLRFLCFLVLVLFSFEVLEIDRTTTTKY